MSEALHCDCDIDDGTVSEHNLDCLVGSIHAVARALRLLGNADAATSMGAFEAFGAVAEEGFLNLSGAIGDISNAMREDND